MRSAKKSSAVTFGLLAALVGIHSAPVRAAVRELPAALEAIRKVGPEGKGNAEASAAWSKLAALPASQLPEVLAGMNGANELGLNWMRAAVDTIAGRASAAGTPLPLAELGQFLLDTRNHPLARRLAYGLIQGAEPATARQLLAGFLNDPSSDLRRDAVEQAAAEGRRLAAAGQSAGAALVYRQALSFAREADQIDGLAQNLRDLGQAVDLVRQFGFLTDWKVIGPFDNTGGAGFGKPFPPEQQIELAAKYEGKTGTVSWTGLTSTNDHGLVNLNLPFGMLKEVTGYAVCDFISPTARTAELRLGCKNGWKIWFNGEFIFGRDEYHRGAEIDQYRLPVQLQPGKNTILVKLCQNEQKEEWTVEWEFQLRVTDSLGTPIYSADSRSSL